MAGVCVAIGVSWVKLGVWSISMAIMGTWGNSPTKVLISLEIGVTNGGSWGFVKDTNHADTVLVINNIIALNILLYSPYKHYAPVSTI